jgi:hypothetical protein
VAFSSSVASDMMIDKSDNYRKRTQKTPQVLGQACVFHGTITTEKLHSKTNAGYEDTNLGN